MDANEMIALLWRGAWVSSLATLAVLALRRPLRQLSGASLVYATWALVPVLTLVSVLPRQSSMQPITPDATAHAVIAAPPLAWAGVWPGVFLAVWAAGVVIAMALAFLQQYRFRRRMRLAEPVGTSAQGIAIYRAQADIGPALIGAWRPTIVVPADFDTRYDDSERALILAHEHIHAARRDGLANALCTVLLALAWFNPLAHLGARIFRRDQEMACDEVVLRRHGQLHIYASAMLKTALACPPLPAGCAWSPVHPLKERIVMLSRSLPGRGRRLLGMTGIALGALVAAGVTYGANPAWDAGHEVGVAVETGSPTANSWLCAAPKCPELPAPPAPPPPPPLPALPPPPPPPPPPPLRYSMAAAVPEPAVAPVVAISPQPVAEPAAAAEPNPAPTASAHR